MRVVITVVLVALCIAGCAAEPHQTPAAQAPAETEVLLFPDVPRHPAADNPQSESDQRVFMKIRGQTVSDVLDWYKSKLAVRGWKAETTVLPPEQVLLFSRDGKYLSVVGHDIFREGGTAALIRLQLRNAPEVTKTEALRIASNTHLSVATDQWIATYVLDYASQTYGVSLKHPVWVLDFRTDRSGVTVWVDAITAEPIQIRQASDP